MTDQVLINGENVSKIFCRRLKQSLWYGVKDIADDLLRRSRPAPKSSRDVSLREGEFWANRDISFEVKRGECLGLIGRNGAGKTTLLKTLNGLIKPDTGRIEVVGNVGALIALGAGFSPVLTGRENIYVNASIFGLSRSQIHEKIDEIVDFAEIEEFLDTPVKSYSSGMRVRLGFAIAAIILKPDVLLLDEVLAVGDAAFQKKCYRRIHTLLSHSAVVLTTHNMDHVAHICNRVLFLSNGTSETLDVLEGIDRYYWINQKTQRSKCLPNVKCSDPIKSLKVLSHETQIQFGEELNFRFELESERALENLTVSIPVNTESGIAALTWHTSQYPISIDIPSGKSLVSINLGPLWLIKGRYNLGLYALLADSVAYVIDCQHAATLDVVSNSRPMSGAPVVLPYQGHKVERLSRNESI